VEFLLIFTKSSPAQKRKAPTQNRKAPIQNFLATVLGFILVRGKCFEHL